MTLQLVAQMRTLALLLRQGESVPAALARLGSGSAAWARAGHACQRGATLGQALKGLIPGELSGVLDTPEGELPAVLEEVANLTQETVRRWRAWRTVLVYPAFLTVVLLGILVLARFSLLPFVALFKGMSLSLPLPTQLMIMLTRPLIAFLVMVPLLGLFWMVFAWPYGRLLLPVLGNELRNREARGFLSWLGVLVQRGWSLPQAVRGAASVCAASPMRQQMLALATQLEQGASFDEASQGLTWFPELARWLLVSAFSTAAPSQALHEASRLLARDSELQGSDSAAVMETVAMLGLGLAALFIMISVFLPMYQLVGNLG